MTAFKTLCGRGFAAGSGWKSAFGALVLFAALMLASADSWAEASIRLTAPDGAGQVAPASFRLRIQLVNDFRNGVQEDVDASSIYLLRNGEFIELQPDVSQDRYESGLAVGTYDYVVKGVAVSYVNGSERLRQIQSPTVRITVTAPTGALSASPNPCTIPWGGSACTASVQWSSNAPNAQLWVSGLAGENPSVFAQGANGSQAASITAAGSRFQLKNGAQVLANLDVRANPTVNVPPSVQVTSPAPGQVYLVGDFPLLAANASDADDSVQRVEFYVSGIKVWNVDTPPYQVHWTAVAGTHSVVARAYDSRGGYTDSAPVQMIVNRPPTVTLTSPLAGAFRTAPGSFAVAADAVDSDGSVSKVEFFVNGARFATATSAPYSAALDQLSAGSYALSAKVTDNRGASATSASVSVVVGAGAAASVARSYVYDAQQRLCKTIEPETGATVVDYDAAGNVAWTATGLRLPDPASCNRTEAAASGHAVVRSYDALGRLKTMTFPDGRGNQVWGYHPDGLASEITTDNDGTGQNVVVNRYHYNKRRLLSSESVKLQNGAIWSSANGYDTNGNRISYVVPDGLQVNYTVNALGQQTGASSVGRTYASGVSYYPNGAIRRFTYGNGIVHTMQQNARQLPTRSTDAGALDLTYAYDRNGNTTTIRDVNAVPNAYSGNRDLSYDGLDRLTGAHLHYYVNESYRYDALDNITRKSDTFGRVRDYWYDGSNRLTNIRNESNASIVGIDYDVQGNLSNKNGQEFRFDYGNRLRRSVGKEAYVYDALGRRLSQSGRPDTTFAYSFYNMDGQLLFRYEGHANEDANNNYPEINRPHIYLGGSLLATIDWNRATQTAQTKYHHTDALGSPVTVTNEAGQVVDHTDWEPYGAAIGKPAYDGVGYTGHVMDGRSGLTYMQQRYYDASIGRFLSNDPVAASAIDGGNFNRYWYAESNPYRFRDPDGRDACDSGSRDCVPSPFAKAVGDQTVNGISVAKRNAATKEVIERVARDINAKPQGDIQLSAGELGILAEHSMMLLAQRELDAGTYKDMSFPSFANQVRGGHGDSVFLLWAEQMFVVEGMPGEFGGRHLGTDINYMMQGMSWAAGGYSKPAMYRAVSAWNAAQGVMGQGIRNFSQIPHARQWAEFGYEYYKLREDDFYP